MTKAKGDVMTLNFEGFQQFLLQYSHFHFGGQEARAYSLIEKLFNQMREAPHFSKLNLQVTKIETVARKEHTVKILDEMTKKAANDPRYRVPDGYKLALKED